MMKKLKKALAMILAVIMLCSLLPAAALADEVPGMTRTVSILGTGTDGAITGGSVEAYYYYDSPAETEVIVGDMVKALITDGTWSDTDYEKFVRSATGFKSGNSVPVLSTIVLIVRPDASHDIGSDGVYFDTASGKVPFALQSSIPGQVYIYVSTGVSSSNNKILVPFATANTVTLTPTTNGTVTASSLRAVSGESVTVKLKPNNGYSFAGKSAVNIYCTGDTSQSIELSDSDVKANADGSYDISFIMPASSVTVTATFEPIANMLSFDSRLFEGGKLTVKRGSAEAQEITSAETTLSVLCGEIVTIKAVAESGNQLKDGKLDAQNVKGASLGAGYFSGDGVTYTLAMPGENVKIVGDFAAAVDLTVASVDNAVVTVRCGDITIAEGTSAKIVPGSSLQLIAAPALGFKLDAGKIDVKYNNGTSDTSLTPGNGLAAADGGYSFIMPNHPTTVTAGASIADYTVSIATNASAVVSNVTGDTADQTLTAPYADTARYGNTVKLTFTIPSGKDLEKRTITYTDNGAVKYITPTTTISGDKFIVTFLMPSADVSVNIQFGTGKTIKFGNMTGGTLTAKSAGVTLGTSVVGESSSAALKAVGGTQVELYPTASAGYAFDSISVSYMNGTLATPIAVNYDSVGGFYVFTVPSAGNVSEILVTAIFLPRLSVTISKLPLGGTVEVFRTSEMTNDNRVAVSSVTADTVSSALLKQNDAVYIYVTPEVGFSVKDISVTYTRNNLPVTMTTAGTTAADTITRDTSYSSSTTSRYYFTMPSENVTVNVALTAPLMVTNVARTGESTASVSFTSTVSGSYYYVKTTSADAAYTSGAAIKTSSSLMGGTGTAQTASSTAAEPVTNTISLASIDANEQYVFIVLQDATGAYSNIARVVIPKVSRAFLSNGATKYSLDYDISGTTLTIKSILDGAGADVTETAAKAIAAIEGKAMFDLTALGTVTDVLIPGSILFDLVSSGNTASKITSLETNFSGYGINIDAASLSTMAAKLSDNDESFLCLGVKSGAYSTLTDTQKAYIDNYTDARILLPRIAYIKGENEPVTSFERFDGSVKIFATHKLAEGQLALGVTGYVTYADGAIAQANSFSYEAAGYIIFTLDSLPNSLIIGYWANPFKDIAPYAENAELYWAFNAAKYNEIAGLFSGMGDGTFSPLTTMNMAQLVTVLFRIRHGVSPDQTAGNYWYSTAANWATASGVISATDFIATNSVTREQFITMFYKTLRLMDSSVSATDAMRTKLSTATDYSDIASANVDAIAWAVSAKLISGTTSDSLTISPKTEINRIQVCQMLKNYYTNIA